MGTGTSGHQTGTGGHHPGTRDRAPGERAGFPGTTRAPGVVHLVNGPDFHIDIFYIGKKKARTPIVSTMFGELYQRRPQTRGSNDTHTYIYTYVYIYIYIYMSGLST